MRKLNKKGFTLVELLAVIVILSVVMLIAVTAVGPLMNRARKNALITEAESLINAAKVAVAAEQLNTSSIISKNPGKAPCVDMKWLINGGYYEKTGDSDYVGSVKVAKSGNKYTYTVWITNKAFTIKNATGIINENAVTDYNATNNADLTKMDTCGVANNTTNYVFCTGNANCVAK